MLKNGNDELKVATGQNLMRNDEEKVMVVVLDGVQQVTSKKMAEKWRIGCRGKKDH